MDLFHHRDRTGWAPPSRPQTDVWGSSPATPRPSRSPLRPLPSTPCLNPLRDITPPEDKATLEEEQHSVVKKSKSPYNQVREYVDRFKDWRSGVKIKPSSLEAYESNLSTKMPMKEWIKLRNDLNIFETDEKYPKYSYDSSSSTLIIQFMPSPVHESIASIFSDGFAVAKSTLPAPLRARITTAANQEYNGFGGQYSGSNKTPDLAVKFKNSKGDLEPKFVLEVGFSETYDDLVQDARIWLEGRGDVSILVLAKFEETPKYRCPVRQLDDKDFEQLGFPEATELRTSDFSLEDEYGLAAYKGFMWVGQFSAAFMEIWKRNPVTGLATRNGSRIDLLTAANPPQIEFKLSDFLDIAPENERTLHFQWGDYRLLIKEAIKELAMFRCQVTLRDRSRLEDIRDLDYIPSDSSQ